MTTPHAITRAKERYGLELAEADLAAIAKDIRAGKGMLIGRQSDGSEVHALIVQGKLARVVVNRTRESVITFLPIDAHFPKTRQGTKLSRKRKRIARRLRKRAA